MKFSEYKAQLAAKEAELRKVMDAHQESLLKLPTEEQHILGGLEACEECQKVNDKFKEVMDFDMSVFGFHRMQPSMKNIMIMIEKIIDMKKEEESK